MTARTLADRLLPPAGLALLAFVLTLPALGTGLGADDYFHRMILLRQGEWGARLDPTFDLFSFVPERQREWMADLGAVPWWSDPELRIALARPLTALTHRLDYALWPDQPWAQHLQSLGWFAVGIFQVAHLYVRVHGLSAVAAMAGLLYALEDAHALPAGWLANRNALLCLVFGTIAVHCHLAWRETGTRAQLAGALISLAVGLGCGEATIGALAYVAAWQITEERRPWIARIAPLLPYAGIVVVWRALYDHSGYGTVASALYVDPGHDPLSFVAEAVQRWPLLFAAQWLQAPIDVWLFLPPRWQQATAVLGWLCALAVIALLFDLLQRERQARFWLLGMSLAMVPVCAAFPMDRLLIFAGIGAFGVMALLFRDLAVWPWQARARTGPRRAAAIALVALHVPLAALMLTGRVASFEQVALATGRGALLSPRGPEVKDQTFIYVNGNDFLVVYTWIMREAEGGADSPRRLAQLSSLLSGQTITREDPTTLVIRSNRGFIRFAADRVMAGNRQFRVGDLVTRPDFVAEIRALSDDGRPLEVAFHFHHPLEHPNYRWLEWDQLRLVDFRPPAVGQRITLPGLID